MAACPIGISTNVRRGDFPRTENYNEKKDSFIDLPDVKKHPMILAHSMHQEVSSLNINLPPLLPI